MIIDPLLVPTLLSSPNPFTLHSTYTVDSFVPKSFWCPSHFFLLQVITDCCQQGIKLSHQVVESSTGHLSCPHQVAYGTPSASFCIIHQWSMHVVVTVLPVLIVLVCDPDTILEHMCSVRFTQIIMGQSRTFSDLLTQDWTCNGGYNMEIMCTHSSALHTHQSMYAHALTSSSKTSSSGWNNCPSGIVRGQVWTRPCSDQTSSEV